LFQNTAPLKTG